MKQIRKILAAIILMAICLSLMGCGGENRENPGSDNGNSNDVSGNMVDVGDFTIEVPKDWRVVQITDLFGEEDANGNLPVRTDAIELIKGGTSDIDALSKPTVYVYYYSDSSAEDQSTTIEWFYDELNEIDCTVNDVKCIAYEAKTPSLSDDEKFYVYDIVFLPAGDESCFQFNIPVDMVEFSGVNLEDADVQLLLSSVKVKE